MHVKVDRKTVEKALRFVGKNATASQPGIMMHAEGSLLRFVSARRDGITLGWALDADVLEDGKCFLPIKAVKACVKQASETVMDIKAVGGMVYVGTLPVPETLDSVVHYEPLPAATKKPLAIPTTTFASIAGAVLHAAHTDIARENICSLHLNYERGGVLRGTCTNGVVMHSTCRTYVHKKPFAVTLPSRLVGVVAPLLKTEKFVRISTSEKGTLLGVGGAYALHWRVLKDFPLDRALNYYKREDIAPHLLTVNRERLLRAIRMAEIVAPPEKCISLTAAPGALQVSCVIYGGDGGCFDETIPASGTAHGSCRYYAAQLVGVLAGCSGDTVRIYIDTATTAQGKLNGPLRLYTDADSVLVMPLVD